ncbi:GNAT family N-acetyltransferase [Streptomyces sp. NBC_01210]|uniref:GNAT family N-acetyltransferase n=1 Tax=Streptomyces sp. NBC_01210 TaxID=2903774 RepID=UPI002E14DC7E|nr:GNAT family N-acetyltransferase [Streptomyces sp. NBC_01210]
MAKRTAKRGSSRPLRLPVDRLRKGWPGPAGTHVRLATAADTDAVDALLDAAGARLIPALRSSIEQGTAGAALLDGLGGTTKTFFEDFARRTAGHTMADSMASVSLTLVAADGQDRPVGALSVTAPGTIIERALEHGYSNVQALTLSVAIGKVHGLAVAEDARGQGLASILMKRAWQVYEQLDYFLLYGSFETGRDLSAFYKSCGYTVRVPGEGFLLERLGLPFGIHAGPDQCVFTRWRPRR